jgi:hypothetical protein
MSTPVPYGVPAALWRTYELLARRSGERALAHGCALCFPRAAGPQVEELEALLRAGHPAFTARVVDEGPPGPLWLHLEGPDGAGDYLRDLLAQGERVGRHRQSRWRWRARRATAPLRALPGFLILGAARCGTTSLYQALASHPQVAPAFRKEVGFFDRAFGEGLGWYRAHFPARWSRRASGEATPEYLPHPHAPRRVRAALPDARLLVLLREPAARAWSHYHLNVRNGFEDLAFEQAIEREDERLAGERELMTIDERYHSHAYHFHSYLARGRYAEQLSAWLEHFARERLLVLATDDLEQRPDETLARVLGFLGLAPCAGLVLPRRHALPRAALDAGVRRRLERAFAPHNARLFELLGRDLGWPAG